MLCAVIFSNQASLAFLIEINKNSNKKLKYLY